VEASVSDVVTATSALSVAASAVHLVLAVSCVIHVLRSRKRASATILWVLTIVYLPWFGSFAYLVFGVNRVRLRIEQRQDKARLLAPALRELPGQDGAVLGEADHATFTGGCPDVLREYFRLLDSLTGLRAQAGNHCQLMRGGEAVFAAMHEAIDAAQHSIHLSTYILDNDPVGRGLLDALARRADAGVEVRVLVDGYGSNTFPLNQVRRFRRKGVDLRFLRQLQPFSGRFAINLRNHRKLLICDGRTAFTGGMNISARHLLEREDGVVDYHTRIDGPGVTQLQHVFAEDWYDASGESVLRRAYFPDVPPAGDDVVRVLNSGPDRSHHVMLKAFCGAIQTAGRSIRIVTPYFVPDPAILILLELAAQGGVDTAVVLPRANNFRTVKHASRYRYKELMQAGVKIYEREPPFSHSKLFLVDGVWACVGSANWDMRTFHLQFDTNIGVVSPRFVEQVSAAIDREIAASRHIEPTTFLPRPPIRGVLERSASLFEDLL